jgi:hypothetical protein
MWPIYQDLKKIPRNLNPGKSREIETKNGHSHFKALKIDWIPFTSQQHEFLSSYNNINKMLKM